MSACDADGRRVALPRPYPLRHFAESYAGTDYKRRRVLAVRLLRSAFGWTYEEIGRQLGVSAGQVKRLDDRGQRECRGLLDDVNGAAE